MMIDRFKVDLIKELELNKLVVNTLTVEVVTCSLFKDFK